MTQKTAKKKSCAFSRCRSPIQVNGYCRLHYLQKWKEIKLAGKAKAEKRLDAYVKSLSKKYPKDYLERLREGLEDDDKFKETLNEIELEAELESKETEQEFIERLSRNIKGGSED